MKLLNTYRMEKSLFKFLDIIGYLIALISLVFLIFTEQKPLMFLVLTFIGILLVQLEHLTSSRAKSILKVAPPVIILSLAVAFAFYRMYGLDRVIRDILSWLFGVLVIGLLIAPFFTKTLGVKKK